MDVNISELNSRIAEESARIAPVLEQVRRVVVGQGRLLDRLLAGLLEGSRSWCT